MNPVIQEAYQARQGELDRLVENWSAYPGQAIRGFEKHQKVDFLKGIEDPEKRRVMARIFENTVRWLGGLDESTRTLQVGSFEKFVFPILRAVMANLVINDLVTVSPLDAPTGLVFYFDVLAGSTKGNVTRGTKLFDVRRGPSTGIHYADEIVEEEALGTGDGATATFGGGTTALQWTPVRPGTVLITDGTQNVHDDGNGSLVGDIAAGTNTINYNTGVYSVTFAAAPTSGDAITATYEYNAEANDTLPEVDLQLTSAAVTARTQKLRARWSIEAQQDFQAYHGISAEVELVAFMANLIAKELNYRVINHLNEVADAGATTWDRTPPASVPWIWHKESLYDAMVINSNQIFQRTQRATGTWIVAGTNVANVVETTTKFTRGGKASSSLAGVQHMGKFGDFEFYKHPGFAVNSWLMGHKGSSFLDTGYIYAPYLQLYTTGTITLDDMISRKGMAMRTGQKVINTGMYATGSVLQTGGAFGD